MAKIGWSRRAVVGMLTATAVLASAGCGADAPKQTADATNTSLDDVRFDVRRDPG